jgi:hypothetical protein
VGVDRRRGAGSGEGEVIGVIGCCSTGVLALKNKNRRYQHLEFGRIQLNSSLEDWIDSRIVKELNEGKVD